MLLLPRRAAVPVAAAAPPPTPTHDISQVDAAPLGGAIAIPLPERERKKLAKYDIPELAGSTAGRRLAADRWTAAASRSSITA